MNGLTECIDHNLSTVDRNLQDTCSTGSRSFVREDGAVDWRECLSCQDLVAIYSKCNVELAGSEDC